MRPRGPAYSAAEVVELVQRGKVGSTKRVAQWLSNHGYDVKETLTEVLGRLAVDGRFRSSCELLNGEIADEYIVTALGDNWYVKFWVDNDQVWVHVWSCCWDGTFH